MSMSITYSITFTNTNSNHYLRGTPRLHHNGDIEFSIVYAVS